VIRGMNRETDRMIELEQVAGPLRERVAELEREVEAQRERAKQDANSWQLALGELDARGSEIDRLRAECEKNKADAERWREVRRGQTLSVVDWVGVHLRAESAESAVDAARAAREG